MPANVTKPSPSDALPSPANLWIGMMEDGARTWLSACSGMAQAWASSSEIQAGMTGEMLRLWLDNSAAAFGPSAALALFASEHRDNPQEEAVLEGASRLRAFDHGGAIQPVPLPE